MFVRAKTIKGQKYAYLVENKWKRGRAKQKVKKYLGKIIEISYDDSGDKSIVFNNSKEMIRGIIINFLVCCGFVQKTKNKLKKGKIVVDLGRFKVIDDEKSVVLKVDNGYLYSKTLRELFKLVHDPIALRPGMNIAEAFIKSGVKISQENFITLFSLLKKEYEED